MADITRLARLLNGVVRGIDTQSNTIVMSSLKLDTTELTKTILDKLILINGAADADGTFDTRYYTKTLTYSKTEIDTLLNAQDDASEITFTPGVLANWNGSTDPGNVDSGLDQLADRTKTVEGTLSTHVGNTSNPHTVTKAQILAAELIVNADVDVAAAIIESKLSLDYSTSGLNTAISGKVSKSGDTMDSAADLTFAGGGEVLGLPSTPSGATAAVSKAYVDAVRVSGRNIGNVDAATIANITLSNEQTIDGYAAIAGDKILVRAQTDAKDNGVYDVVDAGAWTRSEELDNSPEGEIYNGVLTAKVLGGSTQVNKNFIITSVGTGTDKLHTIGTDDIAWSEFTSTTELNAGNGIDAVSFASNTIAVKPDATGGANLAKVVNINSNGIAVKVDDASIAENGSGQLEVKDLGIINAKVSASAAIVESKLSLDYTTSGLNTAITTHTSLTNNPHAVTKAQILAAELIVNADIKSDAAIATTKLADATEIAEAVTFFGVTGISGAEAETLTDGSNADSLHNHGNIVKSMTAGESFAADTTFAVRIAMDGETAGRVYKSDIDASTEDKFYAIGLVTPTSGVIAGDFIQVTIVGEHALGSSDTSFDATEIGQAVHIKAVGTWDAVSQIAYNLDEASYRIGMVLETNKILLNGAQLLGIN